MSEPATAADADASSPASAPPDATHAALTPLALALLPLLAADVAPRRAVTALAVAALALSPLLPEPAAHALLGAFRAWVAAACGADVVREQALTQVCPARRPPPR
ncbi:hypothetical protein Q8F55_007597 [Vanrija albida]|uniref:Uncharacterized protein n=1 Tax=Vanrija albida TaxID=181172 RepID=A0ABR3PU75_9TREE